MAQLKQKKILAWKLNTRSKARVVLNEKTFRDHCERLHRQISSLNLLLCTAYRAQLIFPRPSLRVQELVVDLLEPVFRNDNETAWTVVQTRRSTKASSLSVISRSNMSSVTVQDNSQNMARRFDFENELIRGPVYKRFLLASLCAVPTIEEDVSHP